MLVLDEVFSPAIAAALRGRGHPDIHSVAERVDLRAMTEQEVFAWAAAQRAWLLTENVKDFRPILLQAMQTGSRTRAVLLPRCRCCRQCP